jgi:hypothetical protein
MDVHPAVGVVDDDQTWKRMQLPRPGTGAGSTFWFTKTSGS